MGLFVHFAPKHAESWERPSDTFCWRNNTSITVITVARTLVLLHTKRLYPAKVSRLRHFPQASDYYSGTRHLHMVVLKPFWKTRYSWLKWTVKGIWDILKCVWTKMTFSRSELKPLVMRGPEILYLCNIWFGPIWFIPMKTGLHRAPSYLLLTILSQGF